MRLLNSFVCSNCNINELEYQIIFFIWTHFFPSGYEREKEPQFYYFNGKKSKIEIGDTSIVK